MLCRLVCNALRKFDSVAELLVSPNALIILLKSLCSDESAVLVLLLLDEVLELELEAVSSEIRLFRLLCRLAAPLLPLTLEVDVLLSLSPSLSVLEVLEVLLLPCACNAAIRLCRNAETAWSALLLDDVEDVEEVEDEVDDVPEVDEPELELSLELPTPIDDSALEIAPSKPPPLSPDGGGGGAPIELLLSVLLVPLLVLLLLASWLSWDKR